MARITTVVCDRCSALLTPANWLIDEELCNDCALLISAGQQAMKQDLIQGCTIGQSARNWLAQYQIEPSESLP